MFRTRRSRLLITGFALSALLAAIVLWLGGTSPQRPREGDWIGTGTTVSSVGYSNDSPGSTISRRFEIHRACRVSTSCSLWLTREVQGEAPWVAPLLSRGDSWYVEVPVHYYPCGSTGSGGTIYWPQRSTIVLRFTDNGLLAQGRERDYSDTPRCGYGTSLTAWSIRHVRPAPETIAARAARVVPVEKFVVRVEGVCGAANVHVTSLDNELDTGRITSAQRYGALLVVYNKLVPQFTALRAPPEVRSAFETYVESVRRQRGLVARLVTAQAAREPIASLRLAMDANARTGFSAARELGAKDCAPREAARR